MDEKRTRTRNVCARIPEDVLAWFDTTFPYNGAKQEFVEQCFLSLRSLHAEGKVRGLSDIAKDAVGH